MYIKRHLAQSFLFFIPLAFASVLMADETEIYFAKKSNNVPPNILFLLDMSGSMDWCLDSKEACPDNANKGPNRKNVLKASFKELMAGLPAKLNVGLMHYANTNNSPDDNTYYWSSIKGVTFPVTDIDAKVEPLLAPYQQSDNLPDPATEQTTVREFLPSVVDSWEAKGPTPIVDSLYEAVHYFRGEPVVWGRADPARSWAAHPLSYDSSSGTPVYKTPIVDKCQVSYLVLMSDGVPSYVGTSEMGAVKIYPPSKQVEPTEFVPSQGRSKFADESKVTQLIPDYLGLDCQQQPSYDSGTCGPDLTQWLASTDQNPRLEGDQFVKTSVIGFAVNADPRFNAKEYLSSLAKKGGGSYFSADTLDELLAAFRAIVADVATSSATAVSSPVFTVDQETLLSHGSDVYFPMFEADKGSLWSGNVKKFQRDKDGQIVDGTGNSVLTENGQLRDTAQDLWSTEAGAEVTTGGAANNLPAPKDRKLYTDIIDMDLNADFSLLDEPGSPLMCQQLGTDDLAECKALIQFARGANADGSPRNHMGDMLNNKPVVLNYGSKQRVYVATNEGFLHSLDAATGKEQWAFMPKDLLKNIRTFYQNEPSEEHVYGIDGPITPWLVDWNNDGKIEVGTKDYDGDGKVDNDEAYLFFGLGRGGSVYYALDVSDPDNPRVMWRKDKQSDGFDELGETWSKLTPAKMRIGNSDKNVLRNVLVFGAGFDPAKEAVDVADRSADNSGRDVMIVDTLSGKLLWSLKRDLYGGSNGLKPIQDSIPGDIRVLDMDRNGALDRLYFADTGGNVWRVDIPVMWDPNGNSSGNEAGKLTKIAALGLGGGNTADPRKFFSEPDTALIQHNGQTLMSIALGSGYRSHPLSTDINDRFYVIMDPNVYNEPPDDFQPLTDADLIDHSSTDLSDTNSLLQGNHKGWYYDFDVAGEKVLAPAVTFLNKVIFTTFIPADDAGVNDDCNAVSNNSARAYVLDLFTGKAVANLDRSADDSKDEFKVVGSSAALNSAQIVFTQPEYTTGDDGKLVCINDCQQTVEIRVGSLSLPLMDKSNSDNDSGNVSASTDLSTIIPRVFWRDNRVAVPSGED